MPSLDEGTILDMPITIPRASVTEAADDLKARDAVLRQFPEVESVVGKAGRAETATDPSPPEMIETVVNLRPREFWPKRELHYDDALAQANRVLNALEAADLIKPQADTAARKNLLNDTTMHVVNEFERTMRQLALQRIQQFESEEGDVLTHFATQEVVQMLQSQGKLQQPVSAEQLETIANSLSPQLGPQLATGPDVVLATKLAQTVSEQLEKLGAVKKDANLLQLEPSFIGGFLADVRDLLGQPPETFSGRLLSSIESRRHSDWSARMKTLNWELVDQAATLYTQEISSHLREIAESKKPSGSNSPSLSAGSSGPSVSTDSAPPAIADSKTSASSNQLADLEKRLRDDFAARLFLWQKTTKGLNNELNTTVDMPGWGNSASSNTTGTASPGMAATNASSLASAQRPGGSGNQNLPMQIPLAMVADVRIVEGPSMIKSENGLLRSYVQLNVRDRDLIGFIDEARRAVEEQIKLPAGMYLEWTGEFEHQMHARHTLTIILPIVLLVIFVLLYVTYHDLADTLLVLLLAVPGAVAGGMLFQYLFGFPFTVAVWVGYIACFGLATQSGLVMLV